MSIIIRLQNLPLSAKSGDIRHFFGGLRIPNGGVHIVGGEKGDAFIAFNSDEDARIAMRKDGGKIMDTRIKLYLSSHMEMQHEIQRITKEFSDVPQRLSPHGRPRMRSPLRVRERSVDKGKHYGSKGYKSNSPPRGRSTYRVERGLSPLSRRSPKLRSRSPRMRSRSPRSRSPRRRSRSPRRRSRSPKMSGSRRSRSPFSRLSRSPMSRRSFSPLARSISLRRSRSVSPYSNSSANYRHSFYESEVGDSIGFRDSRMSKRDDYFKMDSASRENLSMPGQPMKKLSVSEKQAQLEKKITEAFESVEDALKKADTYKHIPSIAGGLYTDSNLITSRQEYINPTPERGLQEQANAFLSSANLGFNKDVNSIRPLPPTSIGFMGSQNLVNNPEQFYVPPLIPPPMPMTMLPPPVQIPIIPPPMQIPTMPPPPVPIGACPPSFIPTSEIPAPMPGPNMNAVAPHPGFYITVSGLDPTWNFREVQDMLRGTYVPQNNIKWEIDDRGTKTGTAFIKLSNKEDFLQLLGHATYVFNNRLITVSECPDRVFHRYFLPEWPPKGHISGPQNDFLYFRMKGLPYAATYDDIINFFRGLELTDVYIERGEDGKATGIAYVAFGNSQDFQEALKKSGQKIGHRFVHLTSSTKESMMKTKEKNGDLLSQSKVLRPSAVATNNSLSAISSTPPRRPLCALLTGLPKTVTVTRIKNFFKDVGLKPDAIHITLNNKGKPNSRAFVEFNNVRDFDSALKCHGTSLAGRIICVKQILFDEMIQILNTQKAKHGFENPSETSQNLPEKVPYLWQPPDANQESFVQFLDSASENELYKGMAFSHDNPDRPEVQVFEYGNQSREPTTFPSNVSNADIFYSECNSNHLQNKSFESKKWFSSESPFRNRKRVDDFIFSKGVEGERFTTDAYATKVDDVDPTRVPVKFEVKTKQSVAKKTEVDDAFDRTSKLDHKKKLPKLSPERPSDSTVKPSSNKSEKSTKEKKLDITVRAKITSPERNIRKKDGSNSTDGIHGKNIKSDMKHRTRTIDRRRDNRPYKSPERRKSRNLRSLSRSPPRHGRYSRFDSYAFDGRYEELDETVVQISNVDPVLEGPELAQFLDGFDVNHKKITRRQEFNKPTWDIRVTFRNYFEAERAIKTLNHTLLNGVPVDMFFV